MIDDSAERQVDTLDRPSAAAGGLGWKRLALLVFVLALAAAAWLAFRDRLALEALAAREGQLRAWAVRSPVAAAALGFALYVAVAGLSLPLSTLLTLTLGWFFTQAFGQSAGFWTTLVVVSFGATSGSTLAFLLSRYLFRQALQVRFGERLRRFDEALRREGAFYLFTLRLLPVVPFFLVNLLMGLTPLRTRTFWWVSQVGMLPGTAVYAYAGSTIPSLAELAEGDWRGILTWQMAAALVLLGLFPLAAKRGLQYVRRRTSSRGAAC